MRDPARIERMVALLTRAWRQQPDLRLGQLLDNLTVRGEALYFLEDDVIEARLRRLEETGTWPTKS